MHRGTEMLEFCAQLGPLIKLFLLLLLLKCFSSPFYVTGMTFGCMFCTSWMEIRDLSKAAWGSDSYNPVNILGPPG